METNGKGLRPTTDLQRLTRNQKPDVSTDVVSRFQVILVVRYAHSDSIKEEFLFCFPLDLTTNEPTNDQLFLNNCCTIKDKIEFHVCVKIRAPNVKGVHCVIHRQVLNCRLFKQ